jgi:hypothetical protein
MQRQKSWGTAERRKKPLFAVPPEQQLKFQDVESTVTNWEESG